MLTVGRWPLTVEQEFAVQSAARKSAVCGLRLALSGVEASAVREKRGVRALIPLLGGEGGEAGEVFDARNALLIERAQRSIISTLRCPSTTLRASLSSKERQVSATGVLLSISGRQRSTVNCQRAQYSS